MDIRPEPWLTENAIEFIRGYLTKIENPKILEFGMGSSTIWFCKNFNCELISVEHDGKWYSEIKKELANYNPTLIYKPSTLISPESDLLVESYASVADVFEDEYFDMILIDGRNRVDCFNKSERTLKPDGILVLDNSERSEYAEIKNEYYNKLKFPYMQMFPDKYGFIYGGWTTTIWIK